MEIGRKRSNGNGDGDGDGEQDDGSIGGGGRDDTAADDDGCRLSVKEEGVNGFKRLCARKDSRPLLKAKEPNGRAESASKRRKCVEEASECAGCSH